MDCKCKEIEMVKKQRTKRKTNIVDDAWRSVKRGARKVKRLAVGKKGSKRKSKKSIRRRR